MVQTGARYKDIMWWQKISTEVKGSEYKVNDLTWKSPHQGIMLGAGLTHVHGG